MRFARTFVLAFLSLALTVSLAQPARPGGQTSPPATQSSPQAVALLQKSLAALTGGQTLTDVTLSGTARRIAGSDDESGTATLKALASVGNRIDLSLTSGPGSEVRNVSSAPVLVGSWSGPDAVAHPIPEHNLVTDPGWFPAFTLAPLLGSQNLITYIGPETRNGASVIHLSAYQQFPGIKATVAAQLQRLSRTQIFLDPSSFLPVAICFNTHPDNNSTLDIPVEMDFSDYRSVSGTNIPFHIQKYLNGSLSVDLQFQTAALNSGLTAANFTVEAGL